MNLSYKLEKILQDYGETIPTLVFCNSRKSTMNTCTVLAKKLRNMVMGEKRNQMMSLASRLRDPKLKTLVKEHGVC
jgi:replicative superfamily II helicase